MSNQIKVKAQCTHCDLSDCRQLSPRFAKVWSTLTHPTVTNPRGRHSLGPKSAWSLNFQWTCRAFTTIAAEIRGRITTLLLQIQRNSYCWTVFVRCTMLDSFRQDSDPLFVTHPVSDLPAVINDNEREDNISYTSLGFHPTPLRHTKKPAIRRAHSVNTDDVRPLRNLRISVSHSPRPPTETPRKSINTRVMMSGVGAMYIAAARLYAPCATKRSATYHAQACLVADICPGDRRQLFHPHQTECGHGRGGSENKRIRKVTNEVRASGCRASVFGITSM